MGPYAIIGNPVKASMSPLLFRAAYPQAREGTYGVLEVSDAAAGWKQVLKLDLEGVNVTMPFKKDLLKVADVVTAGAYKAGATNLLVRQNGLWMACNTDIYGVVQSFAGSGTDPGGKTALVIGAGGAGQAAAVGLKQAGATVFIANRTVKKGLLPLSDIPMIISQCDLIVNTIPWDIVAAGRLGLERKHTLLDASYTLRPLHDAAAHAGARYLNGYHWLYHQAVEGFMILTGLVPDRNAMRSLLDL
ncbi:MAG: hypothetical protein WCQ69_06445 [Bacteroidales bacterium]|jgi:shikimate dehydrogenase|nr:hypothetical protein [Bacteroidales bacterium]MDD2264138.1 hypothetical protein [Bacteroidales bacterium]MDD2831391.1 hypothetical protein [Bacteroidales bacterium]MDD3208385.1 hypothetical protein [Bacteroidales bacterium]MDD3696932.1 hypothetical protein [Bacteroidales bacterium]